MCALFGLKSGLWCRPCSEAFWRREGKVFVPGGGSPSEGRANPSWDRRGSGQPPPALPECQCCWHRAQHLSGLCRWGLAGGPICHGSFAGGHYLELHCFRDSQPPREFHFRSSLCFHTRLTLHPPSSVLPLSHFTLLSLNNVCVFY